MIYNIKDLLKQSYGKLSVVSESYTCTGVHMHLCVCGGGGGVCGCVHVCVVKMY